MSAHLAIVFTIAFAVIVNAHIVIARSAPMLPSEMLKNMETDPVSNRMTYEEYQRFLEGWPYGAELEEAPPVSEFMQHYEKPSRIHDQQNNNVDEQPTSVEEYAEPLPIPQALSNGMKQQTYKKSGSQYHMTICHFKICNMGRKRDTSNQKF